MSSGHRNRPALFSGEEIVLTTSRVMRAYAHMIQNFIFSFCEGCVGVLIVVCADASVRVFVNRSRAHRK